MYIYPDNLTGKATMWLWELRDVAIVGIGFVLSVFAMAQAGIMFLFVISALYAFLTIRAGDTSILDFMKYAIAYFSDGSKNLTGG